MTTDWTPTDATAEPNKLVDADELSRAVAHVKEWFAAELAKFKSPTPQHSADLSDPPPEQQTMENAGAISATSDDDVHQTETVDHPF